MAYLPFFPLVKTVVPYARALARPPAPPHGQTRHPQNSVYMIQPPPLSPPAAAHPPAFVERHELVGAVVAVCQVHLVFGTLIFVGRDCVCTRECISLLVRMKGNRHKSLHSPPPAVPRTQTRVRPPRQSVHYWHDASLCSCVDYTTAFKGFQQLFLAHCRFRGECAHARASWSPARSPSPPPSLQRVRERSVCDDGEQLHAQMCEGPLPSS